MSVSYSFYGYIFLTISGALPYGIISYEKNINLPFLPEHSFIGYFDSYILSSK